MGLIINFDDKDSQEEEPEGKIGFGSFRDVAPNHPMYNDCSQEVKLAVIKELESFISSAEEYSPRVASMLRERIKQLKKQ